MTLQAAIGSWRYRKAWWW